MAEATKGKTVALFAADSELMSFVAELLHRLGIQVGYTGGATSTADVLPEDDLAIVVLDAETSREITPGTALLYGRLRVAFVGPQLADTTKLRAEFADTGTFKDKTELERLVRSAVREFLSDPISATVARESLADRAVDVDSLGFEPYVEAVGEFLRDEHTQPPLTMSIEGSWGSGKSSFMLQLRKYLAERGALTIAFNAWRYDKAEELWAAFALQFLRDLRKRGSWFEQLRRQIKLTRLRFDTERGRNDLLGIVALILATLGVWICAGLAHSAADELRASGVVAGLLALIPIWRTLKKIRKPAELDVSKYLRAPDYESRIAFLNHFEQDLPRVIEAFVDKGQKAFIFVDDLDRCDVPHAADLMQAINLMISDQGPLIFVLGIDREKVAAGLAVKHEKLLPYLSIDMPKKERTADALQGVTYGYEFIEKFIQVPFVLPEPTDSDIEKLLGGQPQSTTANRASGVAQPVTAPPAAQQSGTTPPSLAYVTLDLGQDAPIFLDVAKMVAPALDRNPRRIKQFVNLFRLRALIADATGLFHAPQSKPRSERLTLQKLGKFVAIELRWPLLLAHLEKQPKLLAELERIAIDGVGENDTPAAIYWSERPQLQALLRSGCVDADGKRDEEGMATSSLARLDVLKLLRVSPSVKPRPSEQPPPPPPPRKEAEFEDPDEGPYMLRPA